MKKLLSIVMVCVLALSAFGSALAQQAQLVDFTPTVTYAYQDSSLPAAARIDNLLSLLSPDELISFCGSSSSIPRLGLSAARSGSSEGLQGIKDGKAASVFPQPLAWSQTWDSAIIKKVGATIAQESVADNGGVSALAPVLDPLRDPRYGRAYETMGEDEFLTATYGVALVTGMNQRTEDGYQLFMPILKHPIAYNAEINRLWLNTVITPRTANEHYIIPFKAAVSSGGAKSLMNCYPLINGKPMSVSPFQDALLNAWTPDYDGTGHSEYTTTNDYGSGSSMFVHSQRYFKDSILGRALGVSEGTINGEMGWSFRDYGTSNTDAFWGGQQTGPLYDSLELGMLSSDSVFANARRSVAMQLRMGDLDQSKIMSPYMQQDGADNASREKITQEDRAQVYNVAKESIVLLKNDGSLLPLIGDATKGVILLGSMADEILCDHYSATRPYDITIKDALENKLGASNVAFNKAVDTVAIKASNGKCLVAAENGTYRTVGQSYQEDTPILATGDASTITMNDTDRLFEDYDYGSTYHLLRTPINGQYVQVTPFATSEPQKSAFGSSGNAYSVTMINNTNSPGEADKDSDSTQYVNYQTLRIVPTNDGKFGLYSLIAGNGKNGGVGKAYDADDEDTNNGSYLQLDPDTNRIVADLSTIGPYRNENHADGASITESKVDVNGDDAVIDNLKDASKFDISVVQSSEQAIDATIASAADPNAPIVLVVGYEPHLNAREAIDLYETGLSDQQMRNINYITNDLGRDLILVVKTGSPMTINESVQQNPHVKAILEMGHACQEEGSTLVATLFNNGYSVPATGFAPKEPTHNLGETVEAYTEYPGYLEDAAAGTCSANSPAGCLTATWYKQISDMIGASEDHAPASYSWPAYNEKSNDNLSNLNGSVPTGLVTYDIIKGERTYQYFKGTPMYAFGYGLSYSTFDYKDVKVSDVKDGSFTVSGTVTNTGAIKSDKVVQVYSSFAGTPSRITQPINNLIAFDRLKDIMPGETRAFSFNVSLEQLKVWDVETNQMITEPGEYTIKAVAASDVKADSANSAVLAVNENNGGTYAAQRNLTQKTLAENFDDYSNVGGKVDDMELISASDAYESDTAVQLRKDGAWLAFKNVKFDEAAKVLSINVGSDRDSTLSVYAVPCGTALEASAAPIATLALSDTRAVQGLPTGMGIGPEGVYPGSPEGQKTADAYIRPEFQARTAAVSMSAGTYDVYLKADQRGAVIDWFKFGQTADAPKALAITQLYKQFTIAVQSGNLALDAQLDPITAVADVAWSVTDENGDATKLATIDPNGVVTATATGNGTVIVKAVAGGITAQASILITNQLDENKVMVDGNAKTAQFIHITTNGKFGKNDTITSYQGTNQQTVIFPEQFVENQDQYVQPGYYLTAPADQVNWAVVGEDGNQTDLATIDDTGLLTATGVADGTVVVTASLKSNADIHSTRKIILQNQSARDAFKMVQAEGYDLTSDSDAPAIASAYGLHGNEIGLAVNVTIDKDTPTQRLAYQKVDFGSGADSMYIRMAAATSDVTMKLYIDGTLAQTVEGLGNNSETAPVTSSFFGMAGGNPVDYATYKATFDKVEGVHSVTLEFSNASCYVNWFQFQ